MDMLTKVMALELGPHKVSPAEVPPTTQLTLPRAPQPTFLTLCVSRCRSG